MKKLILIISSLIVGLSNGSAQTSIELTNNSAGGPIANNDIITEVVSTGGQSHFYIGIKNISSTTKTYGMTRTDLVLNSGAEAYFCFGGLCYPGTTTTSPSYEVISAGAQSSPAQLYYDENIAEGYSEIKYEIYDVNNTSDRVTFTFKFNPMLTSVKNNKSLFASVSEVYPNPAVNKAQITINSKASANNANVTISNALGSIVSSKNMDLSIGKNTVIIESENLNSGIYFATISSNNEKIVKKFTINK